MTSSEEQADAAVRAVSADLIRRLRATASANEIIVNWPLEAKLLREAADELERLGRGRAVAHAGEPELRAQNGEVEDDLT